MPGAETPTTTPAVPDLAGGVSSAPVPTPTSPRDHLTPHRLVVVLLVREYCQYKISVPTITPGERSSVCLLVLSLVQSPDLDMATTCRKVEEKVPRGLVVSWAGGVSRLQEEGVAGVMDLIQSIEKLLTADTAPVNRSSVLGLLLRRVYLSFDKLTFSEVSALRQQLDHYYRAGRQVLGRLLEREEGDSLEMSLDCDETKGEYKLPSFLPAEFSTDLVEEVGSVSRKQADLLIAQQASLLQTAESAALPPQELQWEISRILTSCPGLPEAHFLSYLNCVRVREVVGALHSLYASFNQPAEHFLAKTSQEEINKGFRYAALNLAAFHSRLNHKEEAMSAIREAITMAQEASDHTCLQHVLSLLYRTVDSQEKQRLMERCIGKCGELSLSYLSSLGIQAFSQHTAATGSKPGVVLELLTRSDVLNCQHSIAELQAMSFMCKAGAWTQYGRPGLACTLAQLLLQLNTADPARAGNNYSGEPTAIALCNVAIRLEARGFAGQADKVLAMADSLFPADRSQLSKITSSARSRVMLWRALARLDWPQALAAVDSLEAGGVPDAKLLRAELFFKEGRLVEARELVQEVQGSESENVELTVRSLLLLADIHCSGGDPAGAVQQLVRAAELATSRRLDHLLHLAGLQLANCQLLLGCSARALCLTSSCLAPLLAHGSLADCARAWLLAAKCKIAASHGTGQAERRAEMLEGANMVSRAKDGFSTAGDMARVKDCLYLLARLYHSLQLTQERNMAAGQYKKLEDLYPVKTRITMDCLV
eukprot:GFUD01032172.1.p1 GENE.GFUD01032172.1~~GFUD01032172.1.p1  ORF type:complete len:768 (-),score=319.74 GFUD01032172.1:114-2417(-)